MQDLEAGFQGGAALFHAQLGLPEGSVLAFWQARKVELELERQRPFPPGFWGHRCLQLADNCVLQLGVGVVQAGAEEGAEDVLPVRFADACALVGAVAHDAQARAVAAATLDAEGADRMVVSSNIGLIDVIFLKGNVVGGVNGATDPKPAEAFARGFVKSLPAKVPAIESGK